MQDWIEQGWFVLAYVAFESWGKVHETAWLPVLKAETGRHQHLGPPRRIERPVLVLVDGEQAAVRLEDGKIDWGGWWSSDLLWHPTHGEDVKQAILADCLCDREHTAEEFDRLLAGEVAS